jgi:hypothetical protein
MKLRAVILGVLTALASATTARAVDSQFVVLALTVRQRTSGLSASTFVRKDFLVERFSNREFLLDLVDDGLIPDIRGWSLVRLSDPVRGDLGFFVVKLGVLPIEVNNRLSITPVTEPIESFVALRVGRGNAVQRTLAASKRELATLRVTNGSDWITARGVLTSASTNRNGITTNEGADFTRLAGVSIPRDRPPPANPEALILDAGIVEGLASFTRARPTVFALRPVVGVPLRQGVRPPAARGGGGADATPRRDPFLAE